MDMLVAGRKRNAGYRKSLLQRHAPVFRRAPGHSHYGKNYKDYVNMPDYIIRKQQSGEIDLTHFSDILRMMLLAQHGGIWMDSTLLIPSKHLGTFIRPEDKFWSCHHHTRYYNISQGGWVSFFLACGKGNILPSLLQICISVIGRNIKS